MSNPISVPTDLPTIDGEEVLKFGRVGQLSGAVPMLSMPAGASRVLKNLRFNDRVFVLKTLRRPTGWALIATDDGQVGYVAENKLFIGAPDPGAKLHYVRPGETAQGIATQHYSEVIRPGADARFFVNVLVYANWKDDGSARGIYRRRLEDDWATTQTRANYYIWIPSVEFASTLEGRVSAGSIRRDAWNYVARTLEEAWEWFKFGVGFVGGLIHGALECVWDMIAGLFDLVGMVWDFIKLVFTGQLIAQAERLWDSLTLANISTAARAMFADFEQKWNDPSSLKRGHFRGWVVGYLVATVLLTVFTLGAAALALAGRIGALIRWVRSIRVLGRALDTAVASARRLNGGAQRARERLREALRRPRRENGRTPEHDGIEDELRDAVDSADVGDVVPAAGAANAARPMAVIAGRSYPPSSYGRGYHGMDAGGDAQATIRQIFDEGLPERGRNMDLNRHATNADRNATSMSEISAYRGTTLEPSSMNGQGAAAWADEGGLVVDIDGVASWDVNALLAGRIQTPGGFGGNVMHGELEQAILSLVPRERIRRIGLVTETRTGRYLIRPDDWVPNPHYVPR
ncbi:MAG: hypothetical protein KUG77_19315 [Nannocystaceae bacterium]|nr:hypothetical protein [Nannocystaceae bacterium]